MFESQHDPLTPRLRMLASLVPPCSLAADIGADHGRLSAALLFEDTVLRALVCDISAPSLGKARELLASLRLEDRALFCVGDGLAAYAPERPQAIVIAGMGAATIVGILERGAEAIGEAALILSPMVGIEALRAYLDDHGMAIEDEDIVRSAHRWAIGLRARRDGGGPRLSEAQRALGPILMCRASPEWRAWLSWRIAVLEKAEAALQASCDTAQKDEIARELAILKAGLIRCS